MLVDLNERAADHIILGQEEQNLQLWARSATIPNIHKSMGLMALAKTLPIKAEKNPAHEIPLLFQFKVVEQPICLSAKF